MNQKQIHPNPIYQIMQTNPAAYSTYPPGYPPGYGSAQPQPPLPPYPPGYPPSYAQPVYAQPYPPPYPHPYPSPYAQPYQQPYPPAYTQPYAPMTYPPVVYYPYLTPPASPRFSYQPVITINPNHLLMPKDIDLDEKKVLEDPVEQEEAVPDKEPSQIGPIINVMPELVKEPIISETVKELCQSESCQGDVCQSEPVSNAPYQPRKSSRRDRPAQPFPILQRPPFPPIYSIYGSGSQPQSDCRLF